MSSDYTVHEPQWEKTEHGWHAVANLSSNGYQWTAYIEYTDASYWRIWAGCMFDSLKLAQEWCSAEIAHQMQRLGEVIEEPCAEEKEIEQQDAWHWLWKTLCSELGKDRTAEIRTELAHRMREDEQRIQSS